jgi:adenylate cyclase class IV
MPDLKIPYEVEIRYHFDSYDDACEKIPFLHKCLREKKTWQSKIYGLEIFKSGRLLRIGHILSGEKPGYYLCLKGHDTGNFANIRQETEEVVTDGITGSAVLKNLGGKENAGTHEEVVSELNGLGHTAFMSFEGEDTYGHYSHENIGVKLMSCLELKWPILVEFEKMAAGEKEAKKFEAELYSFHRKLGIEDRWVKEEPPTILYEKMFGKK